MTFLITGLPRSRTAWFAILTGALHEPDFSVWRNEWPKQGVSCSGAGLHLAEIMERFAPRTVLIERSGAEVAASLARYMRLPIPTNSINLSRWQLALAVSHPLIKRVAYRDLTDETVIRSCLDWLGAPGWNMPQIMHMVIQSDLEFNRARWRAALCHSSS